MDVREQCRRLSQSISWDGTVDWELVQQTLSLPEDRELLLRLRNLAATTQVSSIADPGAPPQTATHEDRARPQLAVGELFAERYLIDGFLDRGGMGEVYRATDQLLSVPVALKVIRREIASSPSSLRLFKQEVLLARSVSHPNVCRIFDLGWDGARGVAYLTMEFLPGRTLKARVLSGGPLAPRDALPVVKQLGEGLDAAHRAGILHRDFKSANIMLVPNPDGDRAVIMDFGLAVELEPEPTEAAKSAPARRAGGGRAVVGTPAYMSPEQVTRGELSPASDLYALGVVLFEMTTGRLPFQRQSPLEMALAHVNDTPTSPEELAALDANWGQTILRLLSKEPSERYAKAGDVLLALEGRLQGTETVRHSLPAERNEFVGRIGELDALAAKLEGLEGSDGEHIRLLTLHGPGGTGKTRLAQRYGWETLPRWPGGVWFCDLSEATGIEGIVHSVATSLDVPPGKGDPVVKLGHAIAGRGRCLVILDNFEQVTESAEATLGRWIQRATEASFLVTSQTRLQLPEETPFELHPLDPETQAVELFEVRARGHRPDFSIDDSNREQVREIVTRLDGLPLAIELAASRLRMLSLEQLGDRLEDRFRVLTGGKQGRHATLRATLEWSWELLQPWEQSAIAQASVFEGGFTLEAAEAVIDLSGHPNAPYVLDAIESLVDKSWLRAKASLGAPRFDTSTTVQEYSSSKLHAGAVEAEGANDSVGFSISSALPNEVEVRHGAYFGGMGTNESIGSLRRHKGAPKRAALLLELDNLVAACRRAIMRKDEKTAASTYFAADAVLPLRSPLVLSLQLGRDVLELVEEPDRRARVLARLAWVELDLGKTEAREHFEAALALHREIGDRRGEGVVRGNLGSLHRAHGRMEEAREEFEAALVIHRESGDGREEATLGNLGSLHMEQGRLEEAREYYEAALAIDREIGHRIGESIVLGNLGLLHMQQGQMERAREHLEAALAIDREIGDRRHEGVVLGNLGNLHSSQGRMEETREQFEAALAISREMGDRVSEGVVLSNLGILHMTQGRTEEAREYYEAALAIHREMGNRRFEGVVLCGLGSLHSEQGRLDEARDYFDAALAINRQVGDRQFEGVVLCGLGSLHSEQGRVGEAREHFEAALTLFREIGSRPFEGNVLCELGDLHMEQSRLEKALEHYETALAIHREVGNRRSGGLVLGRLGNLHMHQERMEEALRCFDESITILRGLNDRIGLGPLLCSLGEYELRQGNVPAARAALEEADSIAKGLTMAPESRLARKVGALREAIAGTEE